MGMSTEGRMVVRLEGDGWMVDHEGPVGDEIQELFGTRTLPTPFLKSTPVSMVVDALQSMNPLVEIVRA